MTRFSRFTITSADPLPISLPSSGSKIVFRNAGNADVQFADDPSQYDAGNYFTLESGTTLVLDQPVGFTMALVARCAVSSENTTLELWCIY